MSEEQNNKDYENANILRSMIEHENTLRNARFSWLTTTQGLLFASVSFVFGKHLGLLFGHPTSKVLVGIFSLAGLFITISCWFEIKRSNIVIGDLMDWWENNHLNNYSGPPIINFKSKVKPVFEFFRPHSFLPVVFGIAWLFVFIANSNLASDLM